MLALMGLLLEAMREMPKRRVRAVNARPVSRPIGFASEVELK